MSRKRIGVSNAIAASMLALLALAVTTRGTTLELMSLDQLAGAADTVVRARCLGSSARWENGAIWTIAQFELLSRFKGNPPARFELRVPGGRVGHLSMRVELAPEFHPGEEAVLFLQALPSGGYGVTAWAEGTFRIRKDSANGRELVTQDSSSNAVFDPQARRFRQEGIRRVPWDDFQQRLMRAVAGQGAGGTR